MNSLSQVPANPPAAGAAVLSRSAFASKQLRIICLMLLHGQICSSMDVGNEKAPPHQGGARTLSATGRTSSVIVTPGGTISVSPSFVFCGRRAISPPIP